MTDLQHAQQMAASLGVVVDVTGAELHRGDIVTINPASVVPDGHDAHEGAVMSVYPETGRCQVFVSAVGGHVDVAGNDVAKTGARAEGAPDLTDDEAKDHLAFTQSPDAMGWAEAFVASVKKNPSIATDEGCMLGWFANAIMCGYDTASRKLEAVQTEAAPTSTGANSDLSAASTVADQANVTPADGQGTGATATAEAGATSATS